MVSHPNKHIRSAIKYAESLGWRVVKSSGKHMFGGNSIARSDSVAGVLLKSFQLREVPRITPSTFAMKVMNARIR